jgi:hypothetical protein
MSAIFCGRHGGTVSGAYSGRNGDGAKRSRGDHGRMTLSARVRGEGSCRPCLFSGIAMATIVTGALFWDCSVVRVIVPLVPNDDDIVLIMRTYVSTRSSQYANQFLYSGENGYNCQVWRLE